MCCHVYAAAILAWMNYRFFIAYRIIIISSIGSHWSSLYFERGRSIINGLRENNYFIILQQ